MRSYTEALLRAALILALAFAAAGEPFALTDTRYGTARTNSGTRLVSNGRQLAPDGTLKRASEPVHTGKVSRWRPTAAGSPPRCTRGRPCAARSGWRSSATRDRSG